VRPNGKIKLLKYTGTDAQGGTSLGSATIIWQPTTSFWLAPEYLLSKVSGAFTDIYSAGIVGKTDMCHEFDILKGFEMSCGHLPYESISDGKQIVQQLSRG
jgi:serine/threonine protein kinase